ATIDFLLSETRDLTSARRFFQKALAAPGHPRPRVIKMPVVTTLHTLLREPRADGECTTRAGLNSRRNEAMLLAEAQTRGANRHSRVRRIANAYRSGVRRLSDRHGRARHRRRDQEVNSGKQFLYFSAKQLEFMASLLIGDGASLRGVLDDPLACGRVIFVRCLSNPLRVLG